ncbi:MAG: hypothetical protein ACLGHT_01825 [Acidimicrobiia bacterium]
MSTEPTSLLVRIPRHWFIYAATIASGLPLGAVVAAANQMPEGGCSGIGFGCSLYGWSAAGVLLLIVGLPYALLLGTVLVVLSFAGRRAAVPVAWVGLAIPWIAVFAAVATLDA